MRYPGWEEMMALAAEPGALAETADYVSVQLRQFLRTRERVLICLPRHRQGDLGSVMEQAVVQAGGIPVAWENDLRWKSLLKLAFSTKATAMIAPPLIALGMTKLSRAAKTPLFVRNLLAIGPPCPDWMVDAIQNGLDCRLWGCLTPGGAVVCGFTCNCGRDLHLREKAYILQILDDGGVPCPDGQAGEAVFSPRSKPELQYFSGYRARLTAEPCPCGCSAPRMLGAEPKGTDNIELTLLGERLQSWSSVLDCRLRRGSYGLEIEAVVFPGERLPKFPTCAKQVVRPWNPEVDEPFAIFPDWRNAGNYAESH